MVEEKEKEIMSLLNTLNSAFPGHLNDQSSGLYKLYLKKYDSEILFYVFKYWIKTKKNPPTIAALIALCDFIDGWQETIQEG